MSKRGRSRRDGRGRANDDQPAAGLPADLSNPDWHDAFAYRLAMDGTLGQAAKTIYGERGRAAVVIDLDQLVEDGRLKAILDQPDGRIRVDYCPPEKVESLGTRTLKTISAHDQIGAWLKHYDPTHEAVLALTWAQGTGLWAGLMTLPEPA